MLHTKRTWNVVKIEDARELASKLSQCTWTTCTGFEHQGVLYLNDSSGPDGAQEYAIVKQLAEGRLLQVESITFGWTDKAKALEYIERINRGEFDHGGWTRDVTGASITRDRGHRCPECA